MNRTVPSLRRLLPALAAAATLVAVAACSSPDQPTAATPEQSPPVAASSAPASPAESSSPTSSPSQTASESASEPAQGGNEALLAAAALAADEVSGSTVVSIDQERNGWEVNVVSDNGDEQQLRTNAEGTSVVSGPTDERPDADDRAENTRFATVSVDYREAVSAVEKEVDGGTITEIALDADRSGIVWEADVRTGSEQRTVQIDADSGKVLRNELDD